MVLTKYPSTLLPAPASLAATLGYGSYSVLPFLYKTTYSFHFLFPYHADLGGLLFQIASLQNGRNPTD
jgi:hypothetical protein